MREAPPDAKVTRRLAAILAADIAGYSRLMGEDEAATMRALKAHQAEVLPRVPEFSGRVIDIAGDGILAEFQSVVDCLQCAVEIQRRMALANAAVAVERRLQFRIGVNLGDVIHDETRIYGGGINVAARLEQVAEPGGIAVSKPVYDQVHDKVDVRFVRLGPADLKNIRDPVEVYRVVLPWNRDRPALLESWRFAMKRRSVRVGAALALVLATVAGIGWHQATRQPAPANETARPAARVKSIAILPFQRIEAKSTEDEYLGVGLADALITSLGNVPQIVVRPTSAIVRYNVAGQDPLAAGREQGVDALLEGTIQKSGQRLRLAVRLLRVRDGASLWAGRFDEDFSDVFRMQDSIADQVTRALVVKLTEEQRDRMSRRYTENVKAYQLYLQGRFYWNRFSEEGFRKAIGFYEEALKLDTSYALAYAGLSQSYSALVAIGAIPHAEGSVRSRAMVEKALALDGNLAEAHLSLGANRILLDWDWAGGERALKRALEINPNQSEAYSLHGYYFQAVGRAEEALVVTRKAVELNPLSPILRVDLSSAYYYVRQYDAAIAEFEKALELDPKFVVPLYVAVQALERKGAYAEAIRRCEAAIKAAGRDPGILAVLAAAHASNGNRAEATRIADELAARWHTQPFPPSAVALAYGVLGDRDKAFEWLERAYREHDVQLIWVRLDPQFDGLRSDARFVDLMRRMGMAD